MKLIRSIGWLLFACVGCQPLPPTGPLPVPPANAQVQVPLMLLPPPPEASCAPAVPSSPQIYFPHQAPVPIAQALAPQLATPVPPGGGPLSTDFGLPAQQVVINTVPNPLPVRVTNHEYAWDQIVDVISDYFPIGSEQRVQLVGNVLTEGRIETQYQIGASIFEPQKRDSVGAFNLWESTLQTIRRRAIVRVIPDQQGYLVDMQVEKELEDLPRPEKSTSGAATFINAESPNGGRTEQVPRSQPSPLWISLGRDQALEQQILADIRQRLGSTP